MEKERLTSLVERSQQGDRDALNELISECYEGFYYFALKTVKDENVAADVTQESCIVIMTSLDKLREPVAFITWSRQIIYHQCARYFKASQDIQVDENEDGETMFDRLPDDNPDVMPEQVYEDKEFRQTMQDLLASLPAEQRSALLLYYYEKLSVKEIAEVQGVTEGTVKSRLNYGRKAMKKKVEEYEEQTGVKLHGAAPIALLLFRLFKQGMEEMPALPAMPAIPGIATAASSAAGAAAVVAETTVSAVGAAAESVGVVVGEAAVKTATVSLTAKIIAGILVAVAVTGTAIGGFLLTDGEADQPDEPQTQITSSLAGDDGEVDGGEAGDGSHIHRFALTQTIDHNYHEVGCSCGEKKTEVHNYEEGKCSVCESKNYFQYNTTPGAGTCVIRGLDECYPVIVIPPVIDGCRVTTLDDYMFSEKANDYDGIKEIVLPDTLTSIGRYAFGSCDELEKINIPVGVTEIGERAFDECENLTEITIPQSVTTIGDFAFSGCTKLESVTYQGTIAEFEALNVNYVLSFNEVTQIHCTNGEYYFGFDYVINGDGKTSTLTGIRVDHGQLVIPEYLGGCPVTRIASENEGKSVYYDGNYSNVYTEEIIIPEGVVEIGDYAFDDFWNLETVQLPDSLTRIGKQAFGGSSLTQIQFMGTVAQWNAIELGDDWEPGTGDCVIHCIDGDIS